ncbi:NAD(P)H-binding protein [Actinokineospora bangkokensis]|uniref:NAD(P)-binding domain-containing protein n=1 Tax=Actinokineospora bangkokensis TaxID=1193682 RepID=A0A1Q9LKB0_9PSEU|nr:NAD(P)H-binding protein [Actinokineospora bangkokensis]OLR92472.1 hypothetical protein BJP25_20560 [Actinokineospora bangkokensis]
MRVVIAGGHGGAGLELAGRLVDRGDSVVVLVPEDRFTERVRATGAHAAVLGPRGLLESLPGADALVFTGGTTRGPSERPGSVVYAEGAAAVGVRRYVVLSTAVPVARPDDTPERIAYLRARAESEAELTRHDLDWTVVRAGRMTDAPATGLVTVGDVADVRAGEVPRADVAEVLAELVRGGWGARREVGVGAGSVPVAAAVRALG